VVGEFKSVEKTKPVQHFKMPQMDRVDPSKTAGPNEVNTKKLLNEIHSLPDRPSGEVNR